MAPLRPCNEDRWINAGIETETGAIEYLIANTRPVKADNFRIEDLKMVASVNGND